MKEDRAATSQQEESIYKYCVSLIIPCHNVPEEQISRMLDCARRQTFSDYEIIVVDDGSSQEFADTLINLCSSDSKVSLIRTDNRGVSSARNTGIQAARGEYVAFADADDVLALDFLERAWTAVSLCGADMVIGGSTMIDHHSDYHPAARSEELPYTLYAGNEIQRLIPSFLSPYLFIRFNSGYVGRGSVARLVRTTLLTESLFDEELKIGEDIAWNLQLFQRARSVGVVQESWYGYWRNPCSATHSCTNTYIDDCRKTAQRIQSLVDLKDDSVYCAYVECIYEMMRRYWNSHLRGARSSDRKAYLSAVRTMYINEPWKELGTLRYMLKGRRNRKAALLFHLHLYFTAISLRERLG